MAQEASRASRTPHPDAILPSLVILWQGGNPGPIPLVAALGLHAECLGLSALCYAKEQPPVVAELESVVKVQPRLQAVACFGNKSSSDHHHAVGPRLSF